MDGQGRARSRAGITSVFSGPSLLRPGASQLDQVSDTEGQKRKRIQISKRLLTLKSALAAFCNRIHIWYPILDGQVCEVYSSSPDPGGAASSQHCLCLIMTAIGSLVQHDLVRTALQERTDAPFMEAAMALLPTVLIESSVRALQCLVFLSVYYLCLVKPCQAHDYVLIASMRAQNLLKSGHLDVHQREHVRRAFWAILLIESELAIQLDLASSGVWKLDNEITLPSGCGPWVHAAPILSETSTDSPSSTTTSQTSSEGLSYFLAEIALRRMLQRCTISIRQLPNCKQRFAPVIAAELELQLEQWHSYLPTALRFDRHSISGDDSNPNALFLRTQYHAYKSSILWPAVYQAIEEGVDAEESVFPFCQNFYAAYALFVWSAAACIPQCVPNTWTLYAR